VHGVYFLFALNTYYSASAKMCRMDSCTTSWTSASFLFPVCHYWAKL